jgi:hypothetical protein
MSTTTTIFPAGTITAFVVSADGSKFGALRRVRLDSVTAIVSSYLKSHQFFFLRFKVNND